MFEFITEFSEKAIIFSDYGLLCPACFLREIRQHLFSNFREGFSLSTFRTQEKQALTYFKQLFETDPEIRRAAESFFDRFFDAFPGGTYVISREELFASGEKAGYSCVNCQIPL
jgi:hypothetical protein